MTFDYMSRIMGSSINFLYLVIVSFMTECTTPFATSSGSREVSLNGSVLFIYSRKAFIANCFSAAAAMPADLGLIEPFLLLNCIFGVIEGGLAGSLLSCVMMGVTLPLEDGAL